MSLPDKLHTAKSCNKYSTALFKALYLLQVIWALGYQPEVLPRSELHP